MTPTLLALTLFISWTLALLVLMEVLRTLMVVRKSVPANGFQPDNANLSPFMQRLARAHANCVESFPVLAGLLVVAVLAQKTAITDPLALVMIAARVVQSVIHLGSLSVIAVSARFTAFAVQMGIAIYWVSKLLAGT